MGSITANTTLFAMTEQGQIYIIGTLATLAGTAFTGWLAYKSRKFSEEAKQTSQEAKQIGVEAKQIGVDTGKAVNGKMEEFKKMAEEFYLAKGIAEGKAQAAVIAAAKAEGKAEAATPPVVLPTAKTP